MEIGNIEKYLSRFKVYNPKTLFPPTAEEFVYWVSRNKCPLCQKKLYLRADKKIARCKSKKSNDKFIITGKKLLELGGRV